MADRTSSETFHRAPAVPGRGIMDYPGKSHSAPHCDKRYFLPDISSLLCGRDEDESGFSEEQPYLACWCVVCTRGGGGGGEVSGVDAEK